MSFVVYILYSHKCDRYYVGHTDDLDRRIAEHNSGIGGKYSSQCRPFIVVYTESFATRSEAMKREKEIKAKKSRRYIELLIAGRG
jgi:putative endonuclease